MSIRKSIGLLILLLTVILPASGSGEIQKGRQGHASAPPTYLQVLGPCGFEFPRDHGAHPGYRVEWWYYTGHVHSEAGDPYGFQLTFFRIQIRPPGSEANRPEKPSAWRSDQIFMAHAAVSDLGRKRFHFDEKVARGALGLAGAVQEDGQTRIFLGPWSAVLTSRDHWLAASGDRFRFDLQCRPVKPPVAHGTNGYSKKGTQRANASCYYSFTRLTVSGSLTLNGETFHVDGSAWMDHEYSTAPLEETLAGWDWFSLQLNDQTELMVYLLRLRKGGYHPASAGTLVGPFGEAYPLSMGDLKIEVLDTWTSRRTGAVYPCRWRLYVIPFNMELTLFSNVQDQELITRASTQGIYWEGSISAEGSKGKHSLKGQGYAEMTGYAGTFDFLKPSSPD